VSEVLLTKIVQDNIGHLTRWAKVAFCARVARRVFPLYRELNVRAPEHFIAIERAISLAEERASKGENDELRDLYCVRCFNFHDNFYWGSSFITR